MTKMQPFIDVYKRQDLVFGGQNMIAENGVILAEGKRFHNGIVYSEICLLYTSRCV